jgi:SAM-dependent methyltransferase
VSAKPTNQKSTHSKPKNAQPISAGKSDASWYDHPRYYDLAFADETEQEADFLDRVFAKFSDEPVRRVFESGCGSGRLVVAMATRNFDVVGFDLNEEMVRFSQEQLKSSDLPGKVIVADMGHFELDGQFDGGFNMIDTFRHLPSEATAVEHLKSVARHLRAGGIYVLGFHLLPPDADLDCTERWRAKDDELSISFTLRVLEASREERFEKMRMSLLIRRAGETIRIRDDFHLRVYDADQARSLFAAVPELELVETFDYWCDIDEPQRFDDDLVDAIFVFRKR